MSTTCRSVTYSVLRRLVIHLYSFFIHMRCTPRVHAQGNELGLTWYKLLVAPGSLRDTETMPAQTMPLSTPPPVYFNLIRRNYVALALSTSFCRITQLPRYRNYATGIVPYSARRIIRVRDLRPKLCPFESKSQVRRPNLFHSNAETMLVFLVEWHRPVYFLKFKFNLFSSLVDVEGSFDIEYVLRLDQQDARCDRLGIDQGLFRFAVNRFPTNDFRLRPTFLCSGVAVSLLAHSSFQFILARCIRPQMK
ncbi:hypothetical protein R3P38DRAFT_2809995 [Favolaschia claudopus]|uniref:Uncharacterized protein n=1 Tax=Favolaschia claudopus TaxID=2862362 RepID=A0AAV9ZCJ6_9AGAR